MLKFVFVVAVFQRFNSVHTPFLNKRIFVYIFCTININYAFHSPIKLLK